MSQKASSEKLVQTLNALNHAVKEYEKGENHSFFTALIQKYCIELYELTLVENTNSKTVVEAKPQIKIVKQEEVLKEPTKSESAEPVQPANEKPKIEPVVELKKETIEKTQESIITEKPIAPAPPVSEIKVTPPIAETPKIEKEKTIKVPAAKPSINDVLSNDDEEELSLNAKLSMNKQPVINIAEKSKDNPISDLSKAISISKKFEFIKGLFNGDGESYKATISYLQNANSHEDALNYVNLSVKTTYNWSDDDELANELYNLIRRRFS